MKKNNSPKPINYARAKKNVSPETKRKATILIISSLASLFIYYGLTAINIPALQLGVMVAYMATFGITLVAYIAYNRAFTRKNVTIDMLPDTWSKEQKEEYIADGERRLKKSEWMLMVIIPLLVTFAAEAMYLFVWTGLIEPMLAGGGV